MTLTPKGAPSTNRRAEAMSSTLRCLKALEFLAEAPFELGVSDIARKLSIAKASAHRLLATLIEGGYLDQDPDTRRYRLAGKALWAGTGFLRRSDVFNASFLRIQQLARSVDGMVHLGVWDRDTILILYSEGLLRTKQMVLGIGDRQPAYATALGKAVLAWRPEAGVRRIMSGPCEAWTESTIKTYSRMAAGLDRTRKRGYAVNREEFIRGVRAMAAPIRDRRGAVSASISIANTAGTLNDEQIEAYASLLLETTAEISVLLGYRAGTLPAASRQGVPRKKLYGKGT